MHKLIGFLAKATLRKEYKNGIPKSYVLSETFFGIGKNEDEAEFNDMMVKAAPELL